VTQDNDIVRKLQRGHVVFDGGLGSMLIAQGLPNGHPPEEWNLSRPETVEAVHRAYREAGADVVTTNTFGATPTRLARHGLLDKLQDINRVGVALVRRAVETPPAPATLVALCIGPTGMMLPPVGDATEAAIAGEFEAQLSCLDGGFDFVLIETMFDVREGLIALEVARRLTQVPVGLSITFNKTPRGFFTVMGDDVEGTARRIEAAGADLIATNCSITSADMLELAPLLRGATERPVLCQPNAGQPQMRGTTPVYEQSPQAFAAEGVRLFDLGVNAVGGCCGTTPDFIRELCTARSRQRAS